MSSDGQTNYERFLQCVPPRIHVHYHTENRVKFGSSSSSSVAVNGEQERKPYISLRDVWSAYEEWSCYGLGVPIWLPITDPLTSLPCSMITQFYVPSLSAMQIYTLRPFADGSSSSSGSSIGKDGTETGCANPYDSGNSRPLQLSPECVGHLYFEHNEIENPYQRPPLHTKIIELAKQYNGLYSLTSSDLSPYSWISVAWYPIYPIPSAKNMKDLSAAFLTYHPLKPNFQGKSGEDDKVKGKGVISQNEGTPELESILFLEANSFLGKSGEDDKLNGKRVTDIKEVVLPAFAAVTHRAFGDVWCTPGTSVCQKIDMHERHAYHLMEKFGFKHQDLDFIRKYKAKVLVSIQ